MAHELAKTILITKVCEIIAKKHRISLKEARDKFYASEIIKLIDDDELGLYGESPWYIFAYFEEENKSKSDYGLS